MPGHLDSASPTHFFDVLDGWGFPHITMIVVQDTVSGSRLLVSV